MPPDVLDSLPGPDMVIDTVDPTDRPTGTIQRKQVLSAKQGFRVVHAFILDDVDRLLLQQLSRHRERHPLYWGSSVAGYVFSGETYDQAIRRRLAQELGLANVNPAPHGKTAMRDEASLKFIQLYTLHHNGPFRPDESHIEQLEFVSIDQILEMRATGTRRFTPTFLHVLDFFLS